MNDLNSGPTNLMGLGIALPDNLVTNDALVTGLDTSSEWIHSRTGILRRGFASAQQSTASLATEAARKAMINAGAATEQFDLIILATASPDDIVPSGAARIQAGLCLSSAAVFDLSAACSGFVYAAHVASGLLRSGLHKCALVVGAETLSRRVDMEDRNTAVIFGDGAGAAILGSGPGLALRYSSIGADGTFSDLIHVPHAVPNDPANSVWISMDGRRVFRMAVSRMAEEIRQALASLGLGIAEISRIIPHQANQRIIDALVDAVGAKGVDVYSCVEDLGNTSSASIPIAMHRSFQARPLRPRERVLTVAFGGGATWGCQVWECLDGACAS